MSKVSRFIASKNKQELLWLQIQSLKNNFSRPVAIRSKLRWMKYSKELRKRAVITAPFEIDIYKKCLAKITENNEIKIGTLGDSLSNPTSYVVLRHDIDLPGCVEKLNLLTSVEEEFGLKSSIVIRVDGLDYDPAICKDLVAKHKEKGFEIGLHSTAYFADDPLKALTLEFERFNTLFGFYPEIYNFHGGFDEHLAKRMKLGHQGMKIVKDNLFLKATDSISGFYEHRIMDCVIRNGERILLDDMLNPPVLLIKKSSQPVIVLTHPCYWI